MKKILVVDDEQFIRESLGVALENIFHCEALLAANGQEALNQFEACREDVSIIISDVKMPVMDGLEMLREIRVKNKTLPVIIISATAVNKDFNDMSVAVVSKPFKMEKLILAVESFGFCRQP